MKERTYRGIKYQFFCAGYDIFFPTKTISFRAYCGNKVFNMSEKEWTKYWMSKVRYVINKELGTPLSLGCGTIFAGKTKIPCGTKIRTKKFSGDDSYLSNLTGTITHPFGFLGRGADVGVYIDQKGIVNFDRCNLKLRDFTIIVDENQ